MGPAITLEEAKVLGDRDVLNAVRNPDSNEGGVFKIEKGAEIHNDPLVEIGIAIRKVERLSSSKD